MTPEEFPWWKYDPLSVRCPECHAEPGEPCWGARGQPRVRKHMARWRQAALAAGDEW